MTNATDMAIRAFNEFVAAWVAPGAHPAMWESPEAAKVEAAIRAITIAERPWGVGYAVVGRRPETKDNRRLSGFETVVVSAVFDDPPTSALEYCRERSPQGLADFAICLLQQIP